MVADNSSTISRDELHEHYKGFILEKYPWMNEETIKCIFHYGDYLLIHDGLTDHINPATSDNT